MDEVPGPTSTVALTGATGFIGRVLQRELLDAGHSVRVLVRPDSLHRRHLDPRARAIDVALSDVDRLAEALAAVDAVVYCAGSVRGCGPDDFQAANVDGLATVCAVGARQTPPPRLLLISSLAASRPQLSDYAQSKHAGELVLRRSTGLAWTILRPPAVYGPGDVEMLPLFRAIRAGCALILGPRAQRLSLLHVEDLAGAARAWLERGAVCRQQSYDIHDGRAGGYTWDDIIGATHGVLPVLPIAVPRGLLELVARVNLVVSRRLGRAPMLTPGKVRELSEPSWLCDNSPFSAATGWRPRIGLREGVTALLRGRAAGL